MDPKILSLLIRNATDIKKERRMRKDIGLIERW